VGTISSRRASDALSSSFCSVTLENTIKIDAFLRRSEAMMAPTSAPRPSSAAVPRRMSPPESDQCRRRECDPGSVGAGLDVTWPRSARFGR